jgi:VIT1/CCC1 family predicted Fe2+/Mn2+ transporter
MAVGEYVSVSTQRDTERAFIEKERQELADDPEGELQELAKIYEQKGLSPKVASQVAKELSAKDPLIAHLDAELNIDQEDLTDPWHAAIASLMAFTVGGLIPLVSILLAPYGYRFGVTFVAVIIALVGTGYVSAKVGGASPRRAILLGELLGDLAHQRPVSGADGLPQPLFQ